MFHPPFIRSLVRSFRFFSSFLEMVQMIKVYVSLAGVSFFLFAFHSLVLVSFLHLLIISNCSSCSLMAKQKPARFVLVHVCLEICLLVCWQTFCILIYIFVVSYEVFGKNIVNIINFQYNNQSVEVY